MAGQLVHGYDLEGNPTFHYFPEGTKVPEVGKLRLDQYGRVNGFFGSDGSWHSLPLIPDLMKGTLTITDAGD